MMSMAGGWFFLMVSEAFVLGEHDFRLPGLGSYMSLALERGDGRAQLLGVLAMLGMILFVDQVVGRPLVAWSHKFTDAETAPASSSWLWERICRSRIWQAGSLSFGFVRRRARLPVVAPVTPVLTPRATRTAVRRWTKRLLAAAAGAGVLFGVLKYVQLLMVLTSGEWIHLFHSTVATFLRVVLAVTVASL